jgi:Clostridium epsilon toxin ETX/Bacillus mosquitocidal toxin MTX2
MQVVPGVKVALAGHSRGRARQNRTRGKKRRVCAIRARAVVSGRGSHISMNSGAHPRKRGRVAPATRLCRGCPLRREVREPRRQTNDHKEDEIMTTKVEQQSVRKRLSGPVELGEAGRSQSVRWGAPGEVDPTIDWPPRITLHADNGKYLSRIHRSGQDNCEAYKSSPDEYCELQVEVLPGHQIALKGDNGKYLSRILRGAIDYTEFAKDQIDSFCKFRYYSLGDNQVALKGDTGKFLTRVQRDGQDNIELAESRIGASSRFAVGDVFVKKEITDMKYELAAASIADESPLHTLADTVDNTLDTPIEKVLSWRYTKSEVGTWNNAVGISVGAEIEFKAGVPFLAEGKITVNTNLSYTHSWGGSVGKTHEVGDSTTLHVPPKTSLRIQAIVRQKLISVDFTYSVKRLLPSGEVTIQKGLKGVYRNVESYDSHVETLDEAPYKG